MGESAFIIFLHLTKLTSTRDAQIKVGKHMVPSRTKVLISVIGKCFRDTQFHNLGTIYMRSANFADLLMANHEVLSEGMTHRHGHTLCMAHSPGARVIPGWVDEGGR